MKNKKEELEALERRLTPICTKNWTDCNKCPAKKDCEKYRRLSQS